MFDNNPEIFNGKIVLVTGGTGSFGTRFAQYVLDNSTPKKLIIFSRDEFKQFEMENKFKSHSQFSKLRFFIGDVRDIDRLSMAFKEVDIVIHAAALKQVVAAEYNPFEFVKTNVIGAENIVSAAIANKVKQVIALSTDKAANPINFYGTTKLASDRLFIAGNNLSGSAGTKFSVVRYGNVVGSRGSVMPFFKNLIENGEKEIPITDERMTRFWITLKQGVNFVASCLEIMKGGELFVPKIPSMSIISLAKAMAPDMPTKIVGIRPGEKIHEIMVTPDDARVTYDMSDRYVILPTYRLPGDMDQYYKDTYKKVPDEFFYSSENNSWWMDENDLNKMISEV